MKKNRRSKKRKESKTDGQHTSDGNDDSKVSTLSNDNDSDALRSPYILDDSQEFKTKMPTIVRHISQENISVDEYNIDDNDNNNESDKKINLPMKIMQKEISVKPIQLNRTTTAVANVESLPINLFGDSEYRETMIFLLAFACNNVFPKRELVLTSNFEFNLKKRSYFCRFLDINSDLKNDLNKITQEMKRLSKLSLPLISNYMKYDECIKHFEKTNQTYSIKLCETTNRSFYKVIGCELKNKKYYILSYRPVLSNLKYCTQFKLHNTNQNGFFVLGLPDRDQTNKNKNNNVPKISKAVKNIYLQGVQLSNILNLRNVGDLNELIQLGRSKEIILLSEAFHDMQIVNIARNIYKKRDDLKIILISGPSSSGKTTFASKLSIQLKLLGMNPTSIEVDMYYKDRDDPTHPFDENGVHNFEVIDALRIDKLNSDLEALINGDSIKVPNFSFKDGHIHGLGKEIQLENSGVLVLEGIFCLNPKLMKKLTVKLGNKIFYKIFMCPISFFNIDNFHFLSEQMIRLIRRISRDHRNRNKKADNVIFKWGQLQGGEDENIFPYVEYANDVFNSSLSYELPILKVFSKPLIHSVKYDSKQYPIAQQLLSLLHAFLTMEHVNVPKTSILQEFMGKSIYEEL